LGWHQFQYCRQNHETLRLPAESRRSVVHTKHATFVLRLAMAKLRQLAQVLNYRSLKKEPERRSGRQKRNRNGILVRSSSTGALLVSNAGYAKPARCL